MLRRRAALSVMGGIVLFLWAFVSHAVIRMYDPVFQGFEEETEVTLVLERNATRGGIYYLPLNVDYGAPQTEAFVNYVPLGERTGFGRMMLTGIIVQTISVYLVLTLLGPLSGGSWKRAGYIALAGITIAFSVHGYFWNWFDFPGLYFGLSVLDAAIGWALAGLAISRFQWS